MTGFLKKYKTIIIISICALAVLTAAFFMGGNLSDSQSAFVNASSNDTAQTISDSDNEFSQSSSENSNAATDVNNTVKSKESNTEKTTSDIENKSNDNTASPATTNISEKTQNKTNENNNSDASSSGKPKPAEPQEKATSDSVSTCTLSISCSTILNNKDKIESDILDIVPDDGWILKPIKVEFKQDETVFSLLQRVCMEKNILMESSWTPVFNSAYIEGINNIYELDCGDDSGWMYSVNNQFPNYGCSQYKIKSGDVIKFQYTCNNGKDIGASIF